LPHRTGAMLIEKKAQGFDGELWRAHNVRIPPLLFIIRRILTYVRITPQPVSSQ